ncbi:YwdI family protein [Sporosarcina sp. FSL K6-1508]|uniref:YwdI family protein n=1 Tax=Sporosarcina sp. FSL K6-1508 TaxID=2921553 RepID=UPI0030F997F2
MIPYDRLISEMERQLSVARRTNDEYAMREALSAVRSLCEVALGGEGKREEKLVPKMLSTPSAVQSITSLEGKPLVEEDANGGSIFDF